MKYIRKSGVIFLGVVVVIIILLNIFLTDKWLERQLENAGSNIVGAKVEIDNLDFSFLKLRIKWDRIQVTHPKHTMKNMIETGPVEFKLSLSALLKKKFVIENMQVLNIRTFTDRKTDGRLPKKQEKVEKREPSFIEKQFALLLDELKKAPAFELVSELEDIKPKDILDKIQLETPSKIDSIRNFVEAEIQKYRTDIENLQNDVRKLKEIEANLRSINPSAIKTVNDLKTTYETVNGSIKQINEIKNRYEAKVNEIKQLPDKFNKIKLEIQEHIKNDIQKVKGYAKLPDVQNINLIKYLVGPKIYSYYLTYEEYSETAEKYIQKMQALKPEKEERPPRLKGQDIQFVKERALPEFWLKRCVLSGETNAGFRIRGEITNVSNQPKIVGLPTRIVITGDRPDKASLKLEVELDFVSNPSSQKLNFEFKRLPISDFNFDHSVKFLPVKVDNSIGDINFRLTRQGGDVKSEFNLMFYNPQFVFLSFSPANFYEERLFNVVKNTFSAVRYLDVNASISVINKEFKASISSSLDRQLTAGFRDAIGREVERLKREAEAMARAKLEEIRKEFEARAEEKIKELVSRAEEYKDVVSLVESLREQKLKELDQEIKKRGTRILENILRR